MEDRLLSPTRAFTYYSSTLGCSSSVALFCEGDFERNQDIVAVRGGADCIIYSILAITMDFDLGEEEMLVDVIFSD